MHSGWITLPQADRARLILVDGAGDVQIICARELQGQKELSLEDTLYVRKVYNSTLLMVTGLVKVPDRERSVAHRTGSYRGHRGEYESGAFDLSEYSLGHRLHGGRLVRKAKFDIYFYRHSGRLGYAKDGCTAHDRQASFFLLVVPDDVHDLPEARRPYGYEIRDFYFSPKGHWSGDKCWTRVYLPDYPISRIHTGQYTKAGPIWEAELLWADLES